MRNTYDILLLKFVLLLGLIFSLLTIYHYNKPLKRDLFRYQIEYFSLNWICVIIYIIGYLGLLLSIRISYLSKISDLRILFNFIHFYFLRLDFINFCYLICFLILLLSNVVYIFIIIHKIAVDEITKRALILDINFYALERVTIITFKKHIEFLLSLFYYPFESYLSKSILDWLYKKTLSISDFILMKAPFIILVLFFFYEVWFNDSKLSSNFYAYVLFYFMYNIYKRISLYIINSDPFLRKMIFNMYYKRGSVMYVDIPDELEQIIYNFVDNGLYRDPKITPVPILDKNMAQFIWIISMEHTFTSSDRFFYMNKSNKCFEEPNNILYDVQLYEYKKLSKYYNNLIVFLYGEIFKH